MTDLYGVIGHPIAHSKSPFIHTEFAKQTQQDITYQPLLAPLDQFKATVEQFIQRGGKGLNVTLPFKQEAYRLSTQLSQRAQLAESVNTLSFEHGNIVGDNTDGLGLVTDLTVNLNISIENKRILLMGAGGAARGVILPLLLQCPTALIIANRTVDKAQTLANQFAPYGNISAITYPQLAGERFDLIINATSNSLDQTIPPLPASVFNPRTIAYDMMYGKGLTAFLQFAQTHGAAKVADGLGMLVEQAAESFWLWRSIRPQTKPVLAQLRQTLC